MPSVVGSKIQIAGWSSYGVLLWALKAAMCTFFLRLTVGSLPPPACWPPCLHQCKDGLEGYRRRIYIGFGFIGATWLAVTLNLFLSCRPLYKMWQIFPDPGRKPHIPTCRGGWRANDLGPSLLPARHIPGTALDLPQSECRH